MKLILVLVALAGSAFAARFVNHQPLIDEVNANTKLWRAGHNERFEQWTTEDASKLLGTDLEGNRNKIATMPTYSGKVIPMDALPETFDARKQWSNCSVISAVRDQANCGSCWAFGSTEAFNARLCIATGYDTMLSAQDTTSCCNLFNGCFGSQGCGGGMPSEAWSYFVSKGVVTGGDYGTTGTCWPYALAPCAHHVTSPKYKPCGNEVNAPACASQCQSGYSKPWDQDLHKAKSSYGFNSVQEMMSDLYQNGPLTTAFSVYEDFLTYKSGVYKHTTGQYLGGHAVEFVGWTTVDGVKAWIVMNSWNESWGNNGTFMIVRGDDECGIESQVCAGLA